MARRSSKKKLRELFVRDAERKYCISFSDFINNHLQGSDRTIHVHVPGSKTNGTHLVPAAVCRLCTKELLQILLAINQSGWSFDGDLSFEDLFVTPMGSVRISYEKMRVLVRADMVTVSFIVRKYIFDDAALPLDMTSFLTVLENSDGDCKRSMYHPGLKEEVAKLCQFEVLYMRSVQLLKLDVEQHTRIMDKLPYCQVNENHWKLLMESNVYFEKVLTYGKERTIWQIDEPDQAHLGEMPPPKRRKLTTAEKKARKRSIADGQPKLPPAGQGDAQKFPAGQGVEAQVAITQGPALKLPARLHATDPQQYPITPGLARQIMRATDADPTLNRLIKPTIGKQLMKLMAGVKPPPVSAREAAADKEAFFQVLMNLISPDYTDDGSGLSRNVRNSQLHCFIDHSVQPARTGRKARKKRGATLPEPATERFNYAQVEHMVGGTLPGFFSAFFLAMADEDEIDSPHEETLSEFCLGGSG